MPYFQGKRVTVEEFIRLNGNGTQQFHTGPNGENPADAPDIDGEVGAPKSQPKKAGGKRSQRSTKAAKAAVADAMGIKTDSPVLADIDVSGLDAPATEEEGE